MEPSLAQIFYSTCKTDILENNETLSKRNLIRSPRSYDYHYLPETLFSASTLQYVSNSEDIPSWLISHEFMHWITVLYGNRIQSPINWIFFCGESGILSSRKERAVSIPRIPYLVSGPLLKPCPRTICRNIKFYTILRDRFYSKKKKLCVSSLGVCSSRISPAKFPHVQNV